MYICLHTDPFKIKKYCITYIYLLTFFTLRFNPLLHCSCFLSMHPFDDYVPLLCLQHNFLTLVAGLSNSFIDWSCARVQCCIFVYPGTSFREREINQTPTPPQRLAGRVMMQETPVQQQGLHRKFAGKDKIRKAKSTISI